MTIDTIAGTENLFAAAVHPDWLHTTATFLFLIAVSALKTVIA
ncbi:MAG: hypothetical protein WCC57_13675 [Paracoccaceae bacterium]